MLSRSYGDTFHGDGPNRGKAQCRLIFSVLLTLVYFHQPLLRIFRSKDFFSPFSTHIIESDEPFLAPHIIITGPEPPHPWIRERTWPRDPQDPEFLLRVQSPWTPESYPDTHYYDFDQIYLRHLAEAQPAEVYLTSDDSLSSENGDEYDYPESPNELSHPDAPIYCVGDVWGRQFHIDEDDEELPPLDSEWCVRAGLLEAPVC